MEVILLERIEKLGQIGEVVKVKPGFARNYLLPQGKALRATETNVAQFEGQRSQIEATNLEHRGEAEKASEKLNDFTCILLRQASDSAQLYGSVTARDIADAASDSGVTINRNQIMLDRPMKTLGIHPIRVALHPEVIVTISVNVARTAEEAEAQVLAERQPAASAESAAEALFESEEAPTVEEIFEHPEEVDLENSEDENGDDASQGEATSKKTSEDS